MIDEYGVKDCISELEKMLANRSHTNACDCKECEALRNAIRICRLGLDSDVDDQG